MKRYALHHFPYIEHSIGEVSRVIKKQGALFISDPCPNDCDKDSFESSIRFPKKKDTAYGYEEVLQKHDKAVIDSYDLVETDTELFVTERVNNLLFSK